VERQAINRSVALSRHLQAQLEEARAMGIGVGIFLLAVGGVLSFAVSDRISGVDLTAVGYILMGAGIVGLAVALVMNSQRSHTSHTTVEERRDLR
jgi:nitrate/nitrite transporter NarK